ncbi:MAG: WxcM-like domain-containing protein [Chloroflexi bacterium]|nr:WxcM-like domain-containing protein [Chloroflexota bacterium]
MSEYFLHPNALVETTEISKGTRVWAFAHILRGAVIGADCNICDQVFIESDVKVGNRVTIRSGVQLWDGIRVEDDVVIGPNATFTNDAFQHSKQHPEKPSRTIIRRGASIGANATILSGLVIGANALVDAGAVVTNDVPPNAIVTGNPARITGYVSATNIKSALPQKMTTHLGALSVERVKLIELPQIVDLRGSLTFGEYDRHLPFIPKRYFVIFNVPSMEVRGEHAHKQTHQFLVCLKGSCSVVVDDGVNRDEITLNVPYLGIYLPPMIWGIQYKFTSDAMLFVLASDAYDAEDYIRDYVQYLHMSNEMCPNPEDSEIENEQ